MRLRHASAVTAIAVAAAALCLGATAADAKCQKLSFLVNDYGKDGPTKDAKNLLDKYIVDWTKEKGIATYTVGKKDVSCELFLNLIVFDEHTCKAAATVCWPDGAGAPAKKAEAGKAAAPIATGTVPAAAQKKAD
jgi:hypothetical protein